MLISLSYIFLVGMFLSWVCKKVGLPGLLGMIFTGILLGPYCLGLIDSSLLNISSELRKIALIIILMRAGLNLDLSDLKRVGRPAILMCFVPACFEMVGMILLAPKLLGISVLDAAIMGSVVAAVSPAVIVPKMLQLMDDTVNGIGNTGSNYRIDSGELIGKTGTAQIADEKSGGYLSGKQEVISSFAGVYPKSNPKIIIYASIKRPPMGLQKPISDAVKDVVNNIGKYLGTEVQGASDNVSLYKLPSFINKTTDTVKTTLTNNCMNYKIIGNGTKVIKQYPAKNEKVTNKDTIYLITNDSSYTVPNVVGLSSKEANDLLKLLGLKVKLEGSGYVISQSVLENTPITNGMEITLTLNKKFEG